MTWERFGYICRKGAVECGADKSIAQCLKEIEREDACSLYGDPIAPRSWARKILDDIGAIEDRKTAHKTISIYRELNLARQFELPMRFKRVTAYLTLITLVFFAVVTVYQVYVMPSFMEMFANLDTPAPSQLLFYQEYWGYFFILVLLFLAATLLVGFRLKALFDFNCEIEHSFIIKHLVLRSIRESYLKIISLLKYPLHESIDSEPHQGDMVFAHLRTVQNSGMTVANELQQLLEIETRSLLEKCENQMKYMSAAIILIIIAAIILFLVGAYSPIFILGETI